MTLLDPVKLVLKDTQDFRGVNEYSTYKAHNYTISSDMYVKLKKFICEICSLDCTKDVSTKVTSLTNGNLLMQITVPLNEWSNEGYSAISNEEFSFFCSRIYGEMAVLPKGVEYVEEESIFQNPANVENAIAQLNFTFTKDSEEENEE